ncbi:MAG TPA: class A beta-lactamase [Verrucomicrobiae bacterium]|nr:class A beta-lactamase [Verrucomicrobiae bacterium]
MLTWIVKLPSFILLLCVGAILASGADKRTASNERDLERALVRISERCGGRIGVAAVHIESERKVAISSDRTLPLYSVVKLPLTVIVLKEVESGNLKLEQNVVVRAEDVAPGTPDNTERWKKAPMNVTIRDLLEFSLVDSDNTSADKLFELIGGPRALERRMQALGFRSFKVETTMKQMDGHRIHPNTSTADGVVQLLVALHNGTVLKPKERTVLFDMMSRAQTGQRRLVAGVPRGTEVLHKTGTGNNAVNDVGLITLPGKQGHIAIAIMISDSKLPTADQEHALAQSAKVIYEAWADVPKHARASQ